jgi:hypothetical protein
MVACKAAGIGGRRDGFPSDGFNRRAGRTYLSTDTVSHEKVQEHSMSGVEFLRQRLAGRLEFFHLRSAVTKLLRYI